MSFDLSSIDPNLVHAAKSMARDMDINVDEIKGKTFNELLNIYDNQINKEDLSSDVTEYVAEARKDENFLSKLFSEIKGMEF